MIRQLAFEGNEKKLKGALHCHTTRSDGALTHASFELKDWSGGYDYARITVIDKDGNHAWTNPIFLK